MDPEAQVEFINGLWDAMQDALNRLEVARS